MEVLQKVMDSGSFGGRQGIFRQPRTEGKPEQIGKSVLGGGEGKSIYLEDLEEYTQRR